MFIFCVLLGFVLRYVIEMFCGLKNFKGIFLLFFISILLVIIENFNKVWYCFCRNDNLFFKMVKGGNVLKIV